MKLKSKLIIKLSVIFVVGILFSITFLTTNSQAQVSGDIVNAMNIVRGIVPASELRPCVYRLGVCPIVSNNCPVSAPLCRLVKVPNGRSTRTRCACTNSGSTTAQFYEPCSSGVNCSTAPIPTVTPRPTATPRPTSTPLPTPTPFPTVTPTPIPTVTPTPGTYSFLQVDNVTRGGSARNGQYLYARTGDQLNYTWDASNAVSAVSYFTTYGLNSCKWANPSEWIKGMAAKGFFSANVQSCQVGSTYDIVYRAVGANGTVIAEQRIYVIVQ